MWTEMNNNIKMQETGCKIASGQVCSEHSNQPLSSLLSSTLYITNVAAGIAQQEKQDDKEQTVYPSIRQIIMT